MSESEAVRALEHAHVPVHRYIGAPHDLPTPETHNLAERLAVLRRRAARELKFYGETLGRLQKAA